jgi:hypothetical protein
MDRILNLIKKDNNTFQFCIIVLFFLFVNPTLFAQESRFEVSSIEVPINNNDSAVTPAKVSTSELNSNMNFILWFMGTKEDVNSTKSGGSFYSKKSVITSGREPNHLLMKTLLKKAINAQSC